MSRWREAGGIQNAVEIAPTTENAATTTNSQPNTFEIRAMIALLQKHSR
jgi:hypothetical protein